MPSSQSNVAAPCNCIMAAHCSSTRHGYCRLAAGGTVNMGGGVCSPKETVASPGLTPERRAALFVLNDLKDKLAEMELHENLPDSHDIGYMAAWREIKEWADAR